MAKRRESYERAFNREADGKRSKDDRVCGFLEDNAMRIGDEHREAPLADSARYFWLQDNGVMSVVLVGSKFTSSNDGDYRRTVQIETMPANAEEPRELRNYLLEQGFQLLKSAEPERK